MWIPAPRNAGSRTALAMGAYPQRNRNVFHRRCEAHHIAASHNVYNNFVPLRLDAAEATQIRPGQPTSGSRALDPHPTSPHTPYIHLISSALSLVSGLCTATWWKACLLRYPYGYIHYCHTPRLDKRPHEQYNYRHIMPRQGEAQNLTGRNLVPDAASSCQANPTFSTSATFAIEQWEPFTGLPIHV
ncbi:hypothetical protein JMJ77_0005469 [Colletotrichum scovillei]|uniref:Uncharacterized protein n=1 Tax=Colletotrichum scovillei TaxID=1209932 RepID=A0A9P7UM42_9PEZI|nr:hypothetical protein JMJ77_0005469 [Colletotrichum scovillei]KAG7076667.1 hypothetical protein JMJ76_0013928 [Colletotrichum scovillei]KAG7083887.1 hypothetical protein JMJ78_0009328 [Colletotrichum scovillei]